MAILAGTTSNPDNSAALIVAVVFVYMFEGTFSIGYSGLPYLYAAEIAPLEHRAATNAISTATLWVFSFLLAEVTPVGLNTIKNRYFIIYAVFNAVIAMLVYFCFPETKGRTLEEIGGLFGDEANVMTHWHDLGEEERARLAQEALKETGHDQELKPATLQDEGA